MDFIKMLQSILTQKNIAAYIVPTSDYHSSEYISDYFKTRAFLSGFTGSSGTLLVTKDRALLWTDGRYHIQAAKEIDDNSITLMRQGLEDVPTITEFLKEYLKEYDTLAFDGKVVSTAFVLNLIKELKNVKIKSDEDLVDQIWNNRPTLPFSMLYRLEDFYTGKTFAEKLQAVRHELQQRKTNTHILVSLEDQAWLYNLRANDVMHTPVFLAYTIITEEKCDLYVDIKKIDKTIEKYLKNNNVTINPYFQFYDDLKSLQEKTISIDFTKANYTIYSNIKDSNKLLNAKDPTLLMKCIKNEVEINNIINAHIKDGVAFTKFMYYVKTNINKKITLTEISVSDFLEEKRKEQQSFVDLSFNTICAYKEHGAMMHYSATPSTNATLSNSDFLLVDSGGHYLDGTTDITRTIALGELTDTQKLHFTTVLKSLIALSQAVFLKGVKGSNLDVLARDPIWKLFIDYKCGTGHGVGYMLSVHEAPNSFRWQTNHDSVNLEPGMITTNEPGIYLENKYGIRIENELLCVEKTKNEFGEFLGFETITYAPIDLDAIDVNLLNQEEKNWLNNYHSLVYNVLYSHLNEEERAWLETYTRKI